MKIAAWIMGKHDPEEVRAGRMNPAGKSNTRIGCVLGIIGIVGIVGVNAR